MAGLGYHLGINKRLISKIESKIFLDKRFLAGTLVPDALKSIGVNRNISHYCNGKLIYPKYEDLQNITITDLKIEKNKNGVDYIDTPERQIEKFWDKNKHLDDKDPYKLGIIMHLYADYEWNNYLQTHLYNFSFKDKGIIMKNLKPLSEEEFLKDIYYFYALLDQYSYDNHYISEEELLIIKKSVEQIFSEDMAVFLNKNINYDSKMKNFDSEVFNHRSVCALFRRMEKNYSGIQKKLVK